MNGRINERVVARVLAGRLVVVVAALVVVPFLVGPGVAETETETETETGRVATTRRAATGTAVDAWMPAGALGAPCTHPLFVGLRHESGGDRWPRLALGDLDGVNGPDFAVQDMDSNDVSVLLNKGDGTFAPAVTYAAGDGSGWPVAIGDLDGVDGPDLAVANDGSDDVSVLLNQGDGTFAAAVAYAAGDGPGRVAIGDLDGVDGPDLVVTNNQSDVVSVLFNQGDGTFAPPVTSAPGDGPWSLAIGDLDGSNGPDLVVGTGFNGAGENSVSVLLNKGDGTFAPAVAYATGYFRSLAIGDLDGVNGPDLATSSFVLFNQGDGTFAPPVAYDAGPSPHYVAIGDLDGVDGPDLVVANDFPGGPVGSDSRVVSVLLNQGDGTFAPRVPYRVGNRPQGVVIGDLDGIDGPDIAVGNFNDSDISVLLNEGDGTFATAPTYAAGNVPDAPHAVAIGDLDGVDGPDLAVAKGFPYGVSVLLNEGDGTFAPAVAYATGDFPHGVAIGDLDGLDGPDLAVANLISEDVSVLLNQGDGTFAAAVAYAAGTRPISVAIGDLDRVDGSDLIVTTHEACGPGGGNCSGTNAVMVLLNEGDGTFAPAVAYDTSAQSRSVAIGDLDGVNGPDLAVAAATCCEKGGNYIASAVEVLLNHGDGTFAAAVTYDAGVGPVAVAIGEFDGIDGPDLAVANYESGEVSVLLNRGDGTFTAAVAYDAGFWGPDSVAIGDLDGVNGPDLAVAKRYRDSVSVLLNQGDGTFAAAAHYQAGYKPASVAIGNLDGANGLDLVVAGGNDVLVLLNLCDACSANLDGDGIVGFGDLTKLLGAWGACGACVEDLTGDGVVGFGDLLVLLATWGPCV